MSLDSIVYHHTNFIQGLYPNSTQVALVGLEQSDDKVIRQYAIDNDFVIVTKDADYYDMTVLYGHPPKIIWLKTGNQSKSAHYQNIARQSTSNRASINDG